MVYYKYSFIFKNRALGIALIELLDNKTEAHNDIIQHTTPIHFPTLNPMIQFHPFSR